MRARFVPLILAAAALGGARAATPAEPAPLAVKVMIVNMFQLEAAPWRGALPGHDIPVPGLFGDHPDVRCTEAAVCQMTTGMGHANAAASMMALLYSGRFDLTRTYFIIAGIGGIDPQHGTVGSAAWARFAVDLGIAHEIDPRDAPPGWHDGYFGINTEAPDQVPKFEYQTEMFQLDEALLQKALALSRSVTLEDSADLQAYRSHYIEAAARRPPSVIQCDTLSTDTWWAGKRLEEHAQRWTRLLTHGAGDYCTTQQEDNATLNALTRASHSGLMDLKRVAVLRTGSDFDRPYPHQSALESLQAQRKLEGGIRVSTDNLLKAAMPLVDEISRHWDRWAGGVPP
jgi:purine nucleoside permease